MQILTTSGLYSSGPIIVCFVFALVFLIKYFKDKDTDWLYFVLLCAGMIMGSTIYSVIPQCDKYPFDMPFYSCMYIFTFLYLKKRNRSLIKNPARKKYPKTETAVLLSVDFVIIMIFSYVVFFYFDKYHVTSKPAMLTLSAASITNLVYPILDFLLMGYYIYVTKVYIVPDKSVYLPLTSGFFLWAAGDFLVFYENIFAVQTYHLGDLLNLLGIFIFMAVLFVIKKQSRIEYTTVNIFADSIKFNDFSAVMVAVMIIFMLIYFNDWALYKNYTPILNTVRSCGIVMLFLAFLRQNIINVSTQMTVTTLAKDARTDPLTGLYSRKYAFNMIHSTFRSAKHFGTPVSALMLDIDHFKVYNDTWGHPCGDKILKTLAQLIYGSVDSSNIVCRYGGEEILIILPGVDGNAGIAVAEKLRSRIENYTFFSERMQPIGQVTVSIGGATSDENVKDEFDLIHKADIALYEAKNERNKCHWCIMAEPVTIQ